MGEFCSWTVVAGFCDSVARHRSGAVTKLATFVLRQRPRRMKVTAASTSSELVPRQMYAYHQLSAREAAR